MASLSMCKSLSSSEKTIVESSLRLKYALSCINVARGVNYSMLKPKQSDCIRALSEKHVIACLRTGYGKSLIFESLPFVSGVQNSTVIIISPLNSIITEQLQRYGENSFSVSPDVMKGLSEGCGCKESDCVKCKFEQCSYRYIIGHPEHFMKKKLFETFKSEAWQLSVAHIVIDEAHCIEKWGSGFRTDFLKISKLRSVFPKAHVLALTGTATAKTVKTIKDTMALRNVKVVKTSIVRNIKLNVFRRQPTNTQESFESTIGPLIEKFRIEKDCFPKTVVYSKLKWCASGYQMALLPMADGTPVGEDLKEMVCQYHASCTEEFKKKVVEKMCSPSIRLLFATEAYSMGTDAPDIKKIVHFGVPSSLETYLQEVGRAGRDGSFTEAELHYNKYDIGQNMPIDPEVREFVLTPECRWEYLCKYFDCEFERESIGHNCCDNCDKKCCCELCKEPLEELCRNHAVEVKRKRRKVMTHSRKVLKTMLTQYFQAENESAGLPVNVPTTGLTDELIQVIVDCTADFRTSELILQRFPYLPVSYVDNIALIVQHTEDFDSHV